MKLDITPDWIRPYYEGKKKNKNYVAALDAYHHVSFHFDGYFIPFMSNDIGQVDGSDITKHAKDPILGNPYFMRLIDLRRPSESSDIRAYRRNIYLPQTKSPCFKVYNSLRKIIKSEDWKIDYSKSKVLPGVSDEESLENYCEKDYPFFGSVENWIYTYGFKHMLVDANALIYVLPLEKEDPTDETEYYKPFAFVVPSKNLYDYKQNQYAIFLSDKVNIFKDGDIELEGKVIVAITKNGVYEARQTSKDQSKFEFEQTQVFEMEHLPAWQLGGIDKHFSVDGRLYDSFLSPIIPGLDAAAREMSDSDAEVVQHVYSTMWYYSMQNCSHCNGTGKVNGKGKANIICDRCNGSGVGAKSPYKDMILNTSTFDQDKMPTPPAGYITKQTDMVKLQAERIVNHIYNALSAINMEWLASISQNQSGKAKEVDKDELNNYVYGISYHLVENIIKPIYHFINEFRYMNLIANDEQRESMLPRIAIPSKFDLLTANIIEQQLKAAMDAKVDPEIIDQLELEYVGKKFPNEPDLRDKLKLKKLLDPFPRLTPEEKSNLILGGQADKIDVVVSTYLHPFIERAIIENKDFTIMEYQKQNDIIYGYAEEKMTKLDAAQKIKDKAKLDLASKQAATKPATQLNGN